MAENAIYGVDIGGYRSVITYLNDKMIHKVIENELGEKYISSGIIFLDGNIGRRMVGSKAFDPGRRDMKFSIKSVKDLFCASYEKVSKSGKLSLLENVPERNDDDGMIYKVGEYELSIEEIYYMLLEKVKEIINYKSTNAIPMIISIPNYYGEVEKGVLHMLCNHLNLNIYSFIPENVSISLSYGYENNNTIKAKKEDKYLMIVDMGYLNCNCTISKYESDKCEIIVSENDCGINGRIIDSLLVEKYTAKAKEENSELVIDDKFKRNMFKELIKCKEKLSATGADTIQVSVDLPDDDSYDFELSVDDINNIIKDNGLEEKMKQLIEKVVEKIPSEKRSELFAIPVGGSMRIPYFQSIIESYVGKEKVIRTLNMDECVASGCSYYGAILNGWWKYEINYGDVNKEEYSKDTANRTEESKDIDKGSECKDGDKGNESKENNGKDVNKENDRKDESKILLDKLNNCIKKINALYKIRSELSGDLKPLQDYITNTLNVIEYNYCFNQKKDVLQCFRSLRIVEDVYRYFKECFEEHNDDESKEDINNNLIKNEINELVKSCESNESLSSERSILERMLKVIDDDEFEKDKEKCIEYMNSLSTISKQTRKVVLKPEEEQFFKCYTKYNNEEIKLLPIDYISSLDKVREEIEKKNKEFTDLSKSKNEYESKYYQYVRIMEAVGNTFAPIDLSDMSVKYLRVNRYGEFTTGKHPNFQPNLPMKEKYSKNDLSISQYENIKNELAMIIDDANQFVNLSQSIKSQVIEKIKTFAGFCKKEKVAINEEKMEEFNSQANDMDLNILIGCLEEIDRVYTHYKANLLVSSIDTLSKTQKFEGDFKDIVDKFKKRSSLDNPEPLYYFEYTSFENDINNKMRPETPRTPRNAVGSANFDLGDTVFVRSKMSYGTITTVYEDATFDVFIYSNNEIVRNLHPVDLDTHDQTLVKGIINSINKNKTYNISYENGEYDFTVKEKLIKSAEEKTTTLEVKLKTGLIFGTTYHIGDKVKVTISSGVIECSIISIEKDLINVLTDQGIIIKRIHPSIITPSKEENDNSRKFKVGDIVEVQRTAPNLKVLCLLKSKEEAIDYSASGVIIQYSFNSDTAIVETRYDKKMSLPLKVSFYDMYKVGDNVIYRKAGENKWYEGRITELRSQYYEIETIEKGNEKTMLCDMENVRNLHTDSYALLKKVNVELGNYVTPGTVVGFNQLTYQIVLPNNHIIRNISPLLMKPYNLYLNRPSFCIDVDSGKIIKGKVGPIDNDGFFTIESNQRISNISPENIFLINECNFIVGSRVLDNVKGIYYRGIITEINRNGTYSLYFDDNDYYEAVAYEKLLPYYESTELFEVGERIINEDKQTGTINEIVRKDDVTTYNIVYDNDTYCKNVPNYYISRIVNKKLLFNVGDIVKTKGLDKKMKVKLIHGFDYTYDMYDLSNNNIIYYHVPDNEIELIEEGKGEYKIGDKVFYNKDGIKCKGIVHSIYDELLYIIRYEKEGNVNYDVNVNENQLESGIFQNGLEVEAKIGATGKEEWKRVKILSYSESNDCYDLQSGSATIRSISSRNIRRIEEMYEKAVKF